MNLIEKTLKKDIKFEGQMLKVEKAEVELPNGKTSTREIVLHKGAVCVAALTENNELIFVKQFRYPLGKVVLELPAGKLDIGKNEVLSEAKRELKEETGIIGTDYVSLGKLYTSPGYSSEEIFLFLCKVKEYGDMCPDEDEFLEVVKIPLNEAYNLVLNGEINDAKTQICIFKAYNYLIKKDSERFQ